MLLTSQRQSSLLRLGLGAEEVATRFPSLRRVDIIGDTRASPDDPIADAVATRTCAEWSALAVAHDLPVAEVVPEP